jgi:hypothetical protein
VSPGQNAAKFQHKVRRICEDDCFAPIAVRTVGLFTVDKKHVAASEFGPRRERPHFAGQAFVRTGSESVKASESKLNELIASRNTKAGQVLAAKDTRALATVVSPATP